MTALRLLSPRGTPSLPPPDESSQRVLDAVAEPDAGHILVIGAAGTGKTTTAIRVAAAAVTERGLAPERVLLIAPTRVAAATLRDRLTLALNRPTGTPAVRTAASTGLMILSAQASSNGEPAPVLLTGAEQDVELRTLLAGHREGLGAALTWDGIVPPAATALPGFREELRNLMMRAAESGLSPDDLAAMGERSGRPEWGVAARAYREYLDVLSFRSMPADQGERFDPARVVADAADAITRWEDVADGSPPEWDLVVVDDYQDATAATTALLRALAQRGTRLILVGNADQSVQGFRGARPAALDKATHPLRAGGLDATRIELETRHRQEAKLESVTQSLVARIGVMGAGSAYRGAVVDHTGEPAPVDVVVASHRYSQSRAIATLLRRARHGFDGAEVPWSQMAVIARSGGQLRELRADLIAADIPCETLGDALALHAEPAVAPLLTMLKIALTGEWSDDVVTDVLSSRHIGLDPVAIRRLRRELVRQEREADGTRSSEELLIEAMSHPDQWVTVPGPEAVRAARACAAVQAGAVALKEDRATAGSVLWAIWEALDVATVWQDAALAGSARDDADLDAVIALMRAAGQFTERLPQAHPAQFVDYVEGQDFAADSLGARAQRSDVVTFATPASASGREWDVVVIAGVEEGVWPNVRLRDSVLGAQYLADILMGRASETPLTDAGRVEAAHAARKAVLDDETRSFAVAASRAKRRVIVTCVESEDSRPSRYIDWIEHAAGVARIRAADIAGVSDLRDAVTRLRIDGANADGEARGAHATMLAHLARAHAPGAHPREWHGVAESSTDLAYWDDDASIRVSPSKVDTVEKCALKWALESAGGTAASSDKQLLGSLIHEIAALHPQGTHDELLAALDERWHEVAGRDTWPDRVQRQKAEDMIRRLARYVSENKVAAVSVEQPFRVMIGRAVLSGSADRVEATGEIASIVDLKTGKAIPAADADNHGQLAMYQLAANHRAFTGVSEAGGARLVFLGEGVATPAIREQPPIDSQAQANRLGDVVEVMGSATFVATPNDMCDHCPIQRSCPARAPGRQVSDG